MNGRVYTVKSRKSRLMGLLLGIALGLASLPGLSLSQVGSLAAAEGIGARQPYTPGQDSLVPFRWGSLTDEEPNQWRIAFEIAAAAWDKVQDRVRFGYSPTPTPDNVMQVYHVAAHGQYGRTQIRSRGGLILSAHMELNQFMCDGVGPLRDALRKSVAAHEQGHGLGLSDMNDLPSIMNQTRDRTRVTEPTAHDVQAIQAIYP